MFSLLFHFFFLLAKRCHLFPSCRRELAASRRPRQQERQHRQRRSESASPTRALPPPLFFFLHLYLCVALRSVRSSRGVRYLFPSSHCGIRGELADSVFLIWIMGSFKSASLKLGDNSDPLQELKTCCIFLSLRFQSCFVVTQGVCNAHGARVPP